MAYTLWACLRPSPIIAQHGMEGVIMDKRNEHGENVPKIRTT